MKPYELVVDHEACWGCRTCEVACKQELSAPVGVQLIYISEHSRDDANGLPQFSYQVNLWHRGLGSIAVQRLSGMSGCLPL